MPNLLSLPRELRDDIYGWLLRGPLAIKSYRLPRVRISKKTDHARTDEPPKSDETAVLAYSRTISPSIESSGLGHRYLTSAPQYDPDPEHYHGEEAVRYPSSKPLPPADALLRGNHQLRAELQETIQKTPVRYKIRLAFREDKEVIYPTWVSMPAFTDRIDVLDIEIRIRRKRTESMFSTTSSGSNDTDDLGHQGDVLFAGLVLLRRFLERGPSFLARKKDTHLYTPTTIGCVTLRILRKDLQYPRPLQQLFDDTVHWTNDILVDNDADPFDKNERKRLDEFLEFFAERIGRFALEVDDLRREWVMRDAMIERRERARTREKAQQADRETEIREQVLNQQHSSWSETGPPSTSVSIAPCLV